MKFKAILFLLSVFIVSCKGESNKPKPETVETKPEKKELIIDFSFKTDVEDTFLLMLNNINVDEFQKKNIHIREVVLPSSDYENINANFGENNFSEEILISLGKLKKTILLNSLKFKYGENEVLINSNNFDTYIRTNDFVDFDQENSVLTSKSENSNDAVLFARKLLRDQLNRVQ